MPDQDDQQDTAVDIGVVLRDALGQLGAAFADDELAYLTVTSKVEGPVRDRLAWALQTKLGSDFVVAREYRRADLAVLTATGTLVAQVEAKVLCTFNAVNEADRARYLGYLAKDAHKMTTLTASDHFLLSIVFDVRGDIPSEPAGVVKYATHINRCAKAHPDGGVRAAARERWLEGLATGFNAPTTQYPFEAGQVWGLDVSVDCFLTGPLPAPSPTGVQQPVQERALRCAHPGMDPITDP